MIRLRRARPPVASIEPTRLTVRDLCGESLAGLLQRPGRSALTMLGTVLGVGSFVAILGLTVTAGGAINAHFDAQAATEVTVEDVPPAGQQDAPMAFPADADQRLRRINGVRAGGVLWRVPLRNDAAKVSATFSKADRRPTEDPPVMAASPGALRAVEPILVAGRMFDDFHSDRAERVALVGRSVAERLALAPLDRHPAIFVGDVPFVVIGIVDDVRRRADLLLSVIVPRGTAERVWGEPLAGERAEMVVETQLGAAQQVADEIPKAVRPDQPDRISAAAPPNPRALRDQVSTEFNSLLLVLAGVSLLIGAAEIANTTLVSVLERTGEIGLRRALGARPRHVAAQFLMESATLGTLGGLLGAGGGVAVVVAFAAFRNWTPLLEPAAVITAPLLGMIVGLVSGIYPAWRAGRVEPVEALRR